MGMDMGMELTLYFLDGVNDLPYVEINDLCELTGMINGEEDVTLHEGRSRPRRDHHPQSRGQHGRRLPCHLRL